MDHAPCQSDGGYTEGKPSDSVLDSFLQFVHLQNLHLFVTLFSGLDTGGFILEISVFHSSRLC
jgi:hypothetical protein